MPPKNPTPIQKKKFEKVLDKWEEKQRVKGGFDKWRPLTGERGKDGRLKFPYKPWKNGEPRNLNTGNKIKSEYSNRQYVVMKVGNVKLRAPFSAPSTRSLVFNQVGGYISRQGIDD